MDTRKAAPVVVAIVAALAIIFGANSLLKDAPRMELPEGEQEISGILKSVPLSATRRGTHVLEVDGKAFTFVESTKSLSSYEGVRVNVKGTFEENTDSSLLPILIATDVRPKTLALQEWKLEEWGISLSVPEEWGGQQSDGLRFQAPDSSQAVLRVVKADVDEMPSGESVTVGGSKSVRVRTDNGETVFVKGANGVIVAFDFKPTALDEQGATEQQYVFRQVVLHSVKFSGAKASAATDSSAPATGTGAPVLGSPCGGDAGILCPAGQYCEVTDDTNIGRCKSVR